MLRRHSFATTLGLIVASFLSTNRPKESNFLHVGVSVIEHLPLAELEALGVQVAALQQPEVQLDGRGDVAVGA